MVTLRGFRGFGAASSAEQLVTFSAKYNQLRTMIIIENGNSQDPMSQADLNNVLARLDSVYQQVLKGDYAKAPSLVSNARNILTSVGQKYPSTTIEDLLKSIQAIPANLAAAAIATAKTAGETIKAGTTGAGIDINKLTDTASSGIKAVGIGVGLAAVAILAAKLL